MISLFLTSALASEPTTWRLELESASEARVPVLGWQKSVTHTLGLVHIAPDGTWTQDVCAVEVRDRSPMARTVIPDAFVAALPDTVARAEIADGRIRVDLGVSAVGWDPARTSTLPERPDDPAVVDHEGDGRPGATVQVAIASLGTYGIEVAHTSRAVLTGTRSGPGWAGGVETLLLDQRVLGADHRMLRSSPPLRSRDADSRFSLTPTEATSCADLAAEGP